MSLAQPLLPTTASLPPPTRKRTNSFSCSSTSFTTPPHKSQRTAMGSLRRTESYICLTDLHSLPSSSSSPSGSSSRNTRFTPVSNVRSVRQCKEKRERRKAPLSHIDTTPTTSFSSTQSDSRYLFELESPSPSVQLPPTPKADTKSQHKQYPAGVTAYRISSPLSPTRTVLPARPVFPRSKHEPDLYRQAITARMRCTPEGQKILHMGPRLALSIMTATEELERIVAAQTQPTLELWDGSDRDIVMCDTTPPSTTHSNSNASWVVVHNEDWEMVDCISA